MKITFTTQQKRERLAQLEAQVKNAMGQPGISFYTLKAERDALREELNKS